MEQIRWNAKLSIAMIPIVSGSCNPTGINQYDLNQSINLYPNPLSSGSDLYLTIALPEVKNVNIEVINVLGQIVLSRKETINQISVIPIEINTLTNGVYFVNVNDGNQKVTRKLIINR